MSSLMVSDEKVQQLELYLNMTKPDITAWIVAEATLTCVWFAASLAFW